MCRQFDSGPRHSASFLANSRNSIHASCLRTPSNHCSTPLQKRNRVGGGSDIPTRVAVVAPIVDPRVRWDPSSPDSASATFDAFSDAGRGAPVIVYQGFRRFRGLDLRFYVSEWFERTMFSRIRRQPLATQFFRACGGLMLAQKLRGRSQAEAQLRRRREEYLCRSTDPAG